MVLNDNALINFILLKQKDKALHEYVAKVKSTKEILELHLGDPIIMTNFKKKEITLISYNK